MSAEESAGSEVVKLTTIVALHTLNGATELRGHEGEKISKCGKCVRLEAKRESRRKR